MLLTCNLHVNFGFYKHNGEDFFVYKKFGTRDYVGETTPYTPNSVQIGPRGASGQIGEI